MTNENQQRAYYSVLIVDDDARNRKILERYLTRDGFFVMTAENAKKSFEMLEFFVPDIILMDYQMPQMDGIKALSLIRKKTRHPIIILMTAFGSDDVEIEAIKNQADAFLCKPLKFKTLGKFLQAHITKKRRDLQQMTETTSKRQIKREDLDDLFSNLLVIYESLPVFYMGDWYDEDKMKETNSEKPFQGNVSLPMDQKILISSFLSAMRSFSTSVLGNQLAHITMGNQELILHSKGQYLVCVGLQRKQYQWLQQHSLFDYFSQALEKILEVVISRARIDEGCPTIQISKNLHQNIRKAIKVIIDETLLILEEQDINELR